MCGIAGCLAKNSAMYSVIQALNKLQNRGYDAAGLSAFYNGIIVCDKKISIDNKSAIAALNESPLSHIECDVAISHTRWATHGSKILENTHPHTSENGQYSLIHNGIIENYNILRNELLQNNYKFYGETDTEIIAKYLEYLNKMGKNFCLLNEIMQGSWAILFLDNKQPNKIFYLKNGSPLIIAFNKENTKIMFVSEFSGLDPDMYEYIIIDDGDYGHISIDYPNNLKTHKRSNSRINISNLSPSNYVCNFESYKIYESRKIVPLLNINLSPLPYEHWILKEINDQPYVLSDLISTRLKFESNNISNPVTLQFDELDQIRDKIINIEHYIFLACGTSYHAAQIAAKFFKEMHTNSTFEVIDGADFEEKDIPYNRNILIILLSQSGETKDLYRSLIIAKNNKIQTMGIINVENSLIAREVDTVLYLKAGREHAVASTKSFTNQIVMLLMVSLWIAYNKGNINYLLKYVNAIYNLPVEFQRIINQSSKDILKILFLFENQHSCFILGKQISEWIAKEGSLKIKEISYIHSEGFSAAALKHGPFALLTFNVPVILLATDDNYYSKIDNATAEIKARYAKVIHITNKKIINNNVDFTFFFETESILFPLLSIVPLQFLAYHLALMKGNNPDYPRNLAKVVTVE